ncbi:MAG: diaminopimelate decarboxylase [Proteobacteria bacterium]|nr:diaminopimelate decarboxylase [Cystobacterineae bacterium]MCL2258466.1 diaminopimelate decarboxylase [Cystobacterineae bacterium]MCL2315194.1 diaminopimelate decarboxylase [Pseudomonadota bacterium]
MDHFLQREGVLFAEEVSLEEVASCYGTPCYVYSRATLERHFRAFQEALQGQKHLVCYAVKANGNLAVLDILCRMGAGFDVVSIGELERVLAVGAEAGKVIFTGTGKREDEMRRALEVGIRCFSVESESELYKLNAVAKSMGKRAPIALRVNPDVNPQTHPYIATGLKDSKFGIPATRTLEAYRLAKRMDFLEVVGMDCHIGSQLTELDAYREAALRLKHLLEVLAQEGICLRMVDVGGGFGIRYKDEEPFLPCAYASLLESVFGASNDYEMVVEPGRAIVGNAGVLLMRVEVLKQADTLHFAVVDAGMSELIRPALYGAWMDILPVRKREDVEARLWEVVGPICESTDFLGKERSLALKEGDLLAQRSAGAYGFSMSSNYNARPRAAEVMVDKTQHFLVRERETLPKLWEGEHRLP